VPAPLCRGGSERWRVTSCIWAAKMGQTNGQTIVSLPSTIDVAKFLHEEESMRFCEQFS